MIFYLTTLYTSPPTLTINNPLCDTCSFVILPRVYDCARSVPATLYTDIGSIDFVIENDLIFSKKIYTIKGKKSITVKENFNKIIKAF